MNSNDRVMEGEHVRTGERTNLTEKTDDVIPLITHILCIAEPGQEEIEELSRLLDRFKNRNNLVYEGALVEAPVSSELTKSAPALCELIKSNGNPQLTHFMVTEAILEELTDIDEYGLTEYLMHFAWKDCPQREVAMATVAKGSTFDSFPHMLFASRDYIIPMLQMLDEASDTRITDFARGVLASVFDHMDDFSVLTAEEFAKLFHLIGNCHGYANIAMALSLNAPNLPAECLPVFAELACNLLADSDTNTAVAGLMMIAGLQMTDVEYDHVQVIRICHERFAHRIDEEIRATVLHVLRGLPEPPLEMVPDLMNLLTSESCDCICEILRIFEKYGAAWPAEVKEALFGWVVGSMDTVPYHIAKPALKMLVSFGDTLPVHLPLFNRYIEFLESDEDYIQLISMLDGIRQMVVNPSATTEQLLEMAQALTEATEVLNNMVDSEYEDVAIIAEGLLKICQ